MKHIVLPRETIVGKDILERITDITAPYESLIVVTGKNTRTVAGNRVIELLDCDSTIVENGANNDEVARLEKKFREDDIDLAIAVGGGSIIDATKLAASRAGILWVSVPTACSNDGIASPVASIKNNGTSISTKASAPIAILADMAVIAKAPYPLIRSGVGDTIAKFSAVRDWKLGHAITGEYYGDYASSLSAMVAEVVLNNAAEIKERTDAGMSCLLEALISSGAAMSIAGSSRPASGSEHKFSHALDMLGGSKGLHGDQCGIGCIIMSYLQGEDWKRIRSSLKAADCPVTLKEIGVDNDMALEALLRAGEIRKERYTILEHIKIDKKIAENALQNTEVLQ
jgi:glycerol-1-phosphate dehydrogenase [NAD(P)+]